MRNLLTRIVTRIAERQIMSAYSEGYTLGNTRGANRAHSDMVTKLQRIEIEKFNNTALTLGFNTALELVKEG